jgi:hypothetical protein
LGCICMYKNTRYILFTFSLFSLSAGPLIFEGGSGLCLKLANALGGPCRAEVGSFLRKWARIHTQGRSRSTESCEEKDVLGGEHTHTHAEREAYY